MRTLTCRKTILISSEQSEMLATRRRALEVWDAFNAAAAARMQLFCVSTARVATRDRSLVLEQHFEHASSCEMLQFAMARTLELPGFSEADAGTSCFFNNTIVLQVLFASEYLLATCMLLVRAA